MRRLDVIAGLAIFGALAGLVLDWPTLTGAGVIVLLLCALVGGTR
jgi:hypothetical protein